MSDKLPLRSNVKPQNSNFSSENEALDALNGLHEKRISRLRTKILLALIAAMLVVLTVPLVVEHQDGAKFIEHIEKLSTPAPTHEETSSLLSEFKELAAEAAIKPDEPVIQEPTIPNAEPSPPAPDPEETQAAIQEETPVEKSEDQPQAARQESAPLLMQALISMKIPRQTVAHMVPLVFKESEAVGIDPLLAAAVIMAESSFNPAALSPKGKIGLMQISPELEEYILKLSALKKEEQDSLEHPQYNLRLGLWYLQFLMHYYKNNIDETLAAYHLGIKNFEKLKASGIPTHTQRYINSVKKYEQEWRLLSLGTAAITAAAVPSPTPNAVESSPSGAPPLQEPVTPCGVNNPLLEEIVVKQSHAQGLNVNLVCALIMAESSFNPKAVSAQGKIGLLQLDPALAQGGAADQALPWEGAERLKDPEYNLKIGLPRLKAFLEKYPDDQELALLAFNLGEDLAVKIKRGERSLPPLAARYLKNIWKFYKSFDQSSSMKDFTASTSE